MTNWHEKLQENYASSYSSQLLLLALWSHKCCLVNKLESLHIDYILCCLFSKTSEIFLGLDLFCFLLQIFPVIKAALPHQLRNLGELKHCCHKVITLASVSATLALGSVFLPLKGTLGKCHADYIIHIWSWQGNIASGECQKDFPGVNIFSHLCTVLQLYFVYQLPLFHISC